MSTPEKNPMKDVKTDDTLLGKPTVTFTPHTPAEDHGDPAKEAGPQFGQTPQGRDGEEYFPLGMKRIPELHVDVESTIYELVQRYTRISSIVVDGEPNATKSWLVVGGQQFSLDGYSDTEEEASLMCMMLARALDAVISESIEALAGKE